MNTIFEVLINVTSCSEMKCNVNGIERVKINVRIKEQRVVRLYIERKGYWRFNGITRL
jgi:hypothetical protein